MWHAGRPPYPMRIARACREASRVVILPLAGRAHRRNLPDMSTAVEAIYENGMFRPLQPLALPEHTRVQLSVEAIGDADREAWLAQSERRLREVWDNDADDVFNELLT